MQDNTDALMSKWHYIVVAGFSGANSNYFIHRCVGQGITVHRIFLN